MRSLRVFGTLEPSCGVASDDCDGLCGLEGGAGAVRRDRVRGPSKSRSREATGVILTSLESVVAGDSLEERCTILRQAGFSGIDMLGDTLAARIPEVRDAMAATAIRLVAVYARLGTETLLAPTVRARSRAVDILRERLETAVELGARAVIFVPIFGPAQMRPELERTVLIALLDELSSHAERCDVPLVLEPLSKRDTHLVYDPRAAVEIVQEIGSPLLRTMVDTYHMERQGLNMETAIRAAAPYMSLVHLSDTNRLLPGQGGINFRKVLETLSKVGFDGPMGMECDGAHSFEALRMAADWLEKMWDG